MGGNIGRNTKPRWDISRDVFRDIFWDALRSAFLLEIVVILRAELQKVRTA